MAHFKAFDPRVELSGGHLSAIIQAFPAGTEKIAKSILAARGLQDPKPDAWYSLQAVLDVMKDLYESFNPGLLTRMGSRVGQIVQLPPHWKSVDMAVKELDIGYKMNHRGGQVGSYSYEDLGTVSGLRRMKSIARTHWPCEYDFGILQGMGERFKQPGMEVFVRKDEEAPCRKSGGDSCTYIVSWG
ncbi:MAG: hypothetical protein V1792_23320 [Pseudomonadota bacterium]